MFCTLRLASKPSLATCRCTLYLANKFFSLSPKICTSFWKLVPKFELKGFSAFRHGTSNVTVRPSQVDHTERPPLFAIHWPRRWACLWQMRLILFPVNWKREIETSSWVVGTYTHQHTCTRKILIGKSHDWYDQLDRLHSPKDTVSTSSSAAAERPREPLSQLKSCQLLHNCTKNHIWLEGLPFHVV